MRRFVFMVLSVFWIHCFFASSGALSGSDTYDTQNNSFKVYEAYYDSDNRILYGRADYQYSPKDSRGSRHVHRDVYFWVPKYSSFSSDFYELSVERLSDKEIWRVLSPDPTNPKRRLEFDPTQLAPVFDETELKRLSLRLNMRSSVIHKNQVDQQRKIEGVYKFAHEGATQYLVVDYIASDLLHDFTRKDPSNFVVFMGPSWDKLEELNVWQFENKGLHGSSASFSPGIGTYLIKIGRKSHREYAELTHNFATDRASLAFSPSPKKFISTDLQVISREKWQSIIDLLRIDQTRYQLFTPNRYLSCQTVLQAGKGWKVIP